MDLTKTQNNISEVLAQIIEPLRLETYGKERVYFGLGDYQGKRLIIHFPVYFSEIPALVSVVNRPINAAHVKEIKDYILSRIQSNKAWLLGSLTVNVNPENIQLSALGLNLYVVRIPNGTLLHIADGQHRIQAITELMSHGHYRELVADEQIPLTLVLDDDTKQAYLDFGDMAQGLSLPPAFLAGFSWEGRNGIAHALVEKVPIFSYTAMNKAVPGSGTKNIYTISYIASFVGSAIAGNPQAELLEYDTQEKLEKAATDLGSFLNRFFSCCPCTAPLVASVELTVKDVTQFKSKSILALSVGLEILGHLIHSQCATSEQLATQIDWSRTGDLWVDLMSNKNRVKVANANTVSQIVDRAIAILKTKAQE